MRHILRSKLMVFAVSVLALGGLGFVGMQKAEASFVQDCTTNSIIKCGADSPSSFMSKVETDSTGDLQAVFADFGLVSSDYSRFVSSSRPGTIYKDGRIVVDGQTVATNAWSVGRDKKSYSWNKTINGKTYYASYAKDVLKPDSLPVMVMFDDKGVMQFAVMNACGNPATGQKVTPSYSCDSLQKTAVSGQTNTYEFTTKASATRNADIVKYVYDFGDGTTATTTNAATPVKHSYREAGNYTAKVTVYVSLPGQQTVTVAGSQCETSVTVSPPPAPESPFASCVSLSSNLLDGGQRRYRFTATTRQGNGATLQSADFNFGDGNTAQDVAPLSTTSVVAEHSYAQAGDYTITATLSFNTTSGVTTASCTTRLTLTPPTPQAPVCPTNPNLLADSSSCKPCPTNASLPFDSPDCQLPNTGVGGLVGLFVGTSVASGLGYRWLLLRRLLRS